jgi:hypothetical protein
MPQANYRFEARPCEPKPPFEGGLRAPAGSMVVEEFLQRET